MKPAIRSFMHATGIREIAAEAGVSLRLVQYYFGTKQELMLAAMQHLAARFSDRAMARIRQSRQGDGPARPLLARAGPSGHRLPPGPLVPPSRPALITRTHLSEHVA
jgi:AcrR family transcriptional regulator